MEKLIDAIKALKTVTLFDVLVIVLAGISGVVLKFLWQHSDTAIPLLATSEIVWGVACVVFVVACVVWLGIRFLRQVEVKTSEAERRADALFAHYQSELAILREEMEDMRRREEDCKAALAEVRAAHQRDSIARDEQMRRVLARIGRYEEILRDHNIDGWRPRV